MKLRTIFSALALGLGLAALPPAVREAEAQAPPRPRRTVFALVVTNNKSAELGRPDLHYADDDGVKYAEVFRMLAPEANVKLLTELDRDSAQLFPHLKGKLEPPTKAKVAAAASAIATASAEALRQGAEVDFYFVFAGHGDVDHGKGFLELRDGRFSSDDVQALLGSVPSTRSHVILDSCNSFFVLESRKAGGRRVEVADEAAKSLRDRLPNVGVFLSTSAEAEVFEWSELQSGIFSHAVRSGLSGAADANHDGVVTYDELRAFVDLSAAKVKNPLYRPRVFAKGPGGRGWEPAFTLRGADARRVELDTAPRLRLTVRDVDELPWIDAHKEEGAAMTLYLPRRVAEHGAVEERRVEGTGLADRPTRRVALDASPEGEPLRFAAAPKLPEGAQATAGRGPDDVLRRLFAAPFGPRAMSSYLIQLPEEAAPVFGVSREETDRMRLLLGQVAEIEGGQRRLRGVTGIAGGGVIAGAGVVAFAVDPKASINQAVGGTLFVVGGASIGLGLYNLHRSTPGERLREDFVRGLAVTDDPGRLVAATEARLFAMADDYRRGRRIGLGLSIAVLVLGTGGLVMSAIPGVIPEEQRNSFQVEFATFSLVGSLYLADSLFPTPIERLAEVWRTDPGRERVSLPRLSLAPMIGPRGLGVAGTF